MKQQPDGFAIAFNRHRNTWKWKQTERVAESRTAGHCVEREGLPSRRACLQDIISEIDRRSAPPQEIATTGAA